MCVIIALVLSIIVTIESRIIYNEDSHCNSSYGGAFKCVNSTECISLNAVCDGNKDCQDGSDEIYCFYDQSNISGTTSTRYKRQFSCKRSQWQCRDGTCISFDGKCDGTVDCPDRSDETHALCRNMTCQSNLFRCAYGACVDGTAPCNKIFDCADKSDELLPRCRQEKLEDNGQFKCEDGSRIPATDRCDGAPDCPDDSDETVRACAGTLCPKNLFQCAYGACVDSGANCNGKQECADGSDEADELCNDIINSDRLGGANTTPGVCELPPYPPHGRYQVQNAPNARPGQISNYFLLTVSCDPPYGIIDADRNGKKQIYCSLGKMDKMPECVQFCKLNIADPSVKYNCKILRGTGYRDCNNYEPPGTVVKPVCNEPHYYSQEVLPSMTCISFGSWDNDASCTPECGQLAPTGDQLASGGVSAKFGELPWHAGVYHKIYRPWMQVCGGSLVNPRAVISAAHCFWDDRLQVKRLPASDFAVAIGKLYRQWDESHDLYAQKSDVKQIKLPPLFAGRAASNQDDIAILIMSSPFNYTSYVNPVCLSFRSRFDRLQLMDGQVGRVAGWGLTTASGKPSQVLKLVDLPIINIDTCINTFPTTFRPFITGDKICAGYINGTTVCKGDSGGGLVFLASEQGVDRYYLRAIVSSAPKDEDNIDAICNINTYSAFTKISYHEDFVLESI